MPSPQKKTIGVGEVTKRRESKNRRLKLLIQTVPIIVQMKNYKNGLLPPSAKGDFSRGVNFGGYWGEEYPLKICKKIGGLCF